MPRVRSVLVVLLVLSAAVAAPVPKAKKATYPHAKGTRWEYTHDGDEKNVYAEEITESEEKDGVVTFTVTVTPGDGGETQWEKYQIKDGRVAVTAASWGEFAAPMVIRTDAMKEGDSWTCKYTQGGAEYEDKFTAGKAEEITTPAGKWTATPVTRQTVNLRGGRTSVYWYVDGVGMVRNTVDGQEHPAQELKAFTPAKK